MDVGIQLRAWFNLCYRDTFWYHEFIMYLFSKCIPADLKSLGSLWFDLRSFCYPLCSDMHRYVIDK